MDKQMLINRDNQEALGKYFLKKGVDFAIQKSFGKSYEFFKLGLDLVTCDCGNWRQRFVESDKSIFEDLEIKVDDPLDYYFVKGYLLSFELEKKELYLGLDAIEKYFKGRKDQYGLYVKGEILLRLQLPLKAKIAYSEAENSFGSNSRLKYRIGRTNEQHLESHGLNELYHSFVNNPSSPCSVRVLKKYMMKRKIEIPFAGESINPLINSFLKIEDEWVFHALYKEYLSNTYVAADPINFSNTKDSQWETLPAIIEFIVFLRSNTELFISAEDNWAEDDDYEPNYDRDTFDALTDGQSGDYDDWRDSGGDFDNLYDAMGH